MGMSATLRKAPPNTETVLVVDDEFAENSTGLIQLRGAVERLGLTLRIEASTSTAAKTVSDFGDQLSLVVLDIMFKNRVSGLAMDGVDFFVTLRKKYPDIPVLILTQLSRSGIRSKLEIEGISARDCVILSKNYGLDLLKNAMKGYVSSKERWLRYWKGVELTEENLLKGRKSPDDKASENEISLFTKTGYILGTEHDYVRVHMEELADEPLLVPAFYFDDFHTVDRGTTFDLVITRSGSRTTCRIKPRLIKAQPVSKEMMGIIDEFEQFESLGRWRIRSNEEAEDE